MLTDTQRLSLKQIADNPVLLEAVKEIFVNQFTSETDTESLTITNEQLGAITRARLDGLAKINKALTIIKSYQSVPINQTFSNPAI